MKIPNTLTAIATAVAISAYYCTSAATADESASPKFIIVTKGQLGFKEGKDFYELGMTFTDFRNKFGPPEKSNSDQGRQWYNYTNDGLTVNVASDGTIDGFIFCVAACDTVQAASVATDTGIARGASAREIVRQHAEPTKKLAVSDMMTLGYKYQNGDGLLFCFSNGLLNTINIVHGAAFFKE